MSDVFVAPRLKRPHFKGVPYCGIVETTGLRGSFMSFKSTSWFASSISCISFKAFMFFKGTPSTGFFTSILPCNRPLVVSKSMPLE